MSDAVSVCRKELSEKFIVWLNKNRKKIGDKWYEKLLKNFRKAKMNDEAHVLATALWMFNMLGNLGVIGGIGVSFGYVIHEMRGDLDRETTEDLLETISKCFREMQGIEWASG